MNIANIFGLHIGCKVKYDDVVNIIFGVSVAGVISIEPKPVRFDKCKLILKPLSKITDEDKAEFVEKFYPTDSLFWRYMRIVSFQASGLNVYSTRREESYSVPYTYQQALFLSTKGYKIEGIVPDEYKEVEE